MGWFSSSHKTVSSTTNLTQTDAHVDTTMRDVGLTGAQAVDLASVIGVSGVTQTRQIADSLTALNQSTGSNYNALVGGASNLIDTTGKLATGNLSTISDIANKGFSLVGDISSDSSNLSREQLQSTSSAFDSLVNSFASAFHDLLGISESVSQDVLSRSQAVAQDTLQTGSEALPGIVSSQAIREENSLTKTIPWIAGAVAVYAIFRS